MIETNLPKWTWFITSTTYATWLPGDKRGFVSKIVDTSNRKVIHNVHNEPYDSDISALNNDVKGKLKGNPVYLTVNQANVLADQFRETALFRRWNLFAFAIMENHFHLVVETEQSKSGVVILRDFKVNASRKLNETFGRTTSGQWWSDGGSTRLLFSNEALVQTMDYVRSQKSPLVVWESTKERGGVSPPMLSVACDKAGVIPA